jgi:hypothetical protein
MPANRAAAMGLGRQNVSRRHWRKRRPVFEISTRFSHELFPKGRGGAGGAFQPTAATLLKNAGKDRIPRPAACVPSQGVLELIETSDKVARLSEAGYAYETKLGALEHQFEVHARPRQLQAPEM